MSVSDPLPADLAEAHAMILAERAARLAAEAEAAIAKQTKRLLDLEIERLKLEIARLKRQRFGTSAERSARLEQLELALFELQESVAEVEATAELQISEPSPRSTATSRKPARRPLPEHLPWTRILSTRPPPPLSLLRRCGPPAGRGDHREPGAAAGALVRHPARPREGYLPVMREHQRGARAVSPDRPWPRRSQPLGRGGVRQVRHASAAEPAERRLRPRGRRA